MTLALVCYILTFAVSWTQIGELDKLVVGVKQKQAICLAAVSQYESEIGFIDQEVRHIMERYTPLVRRLASRKLERKELVDQSSVAAKEFGDILATTKQRLRNTTHDQVRNLRHEATNELSGARGYPIGRESTLYQKTLVARK